MDFVIVCEFVRNVAINSVFQVIESEIHDERNRVVTIDWRSENERYTHAYESLRKVTTTCESTRILWHLNFLPQQFFVDICLT